jgi:hypothetical protein
MTICVDPNKYSRKITISVPEKIVGCLQDIAVGFSKGYEFAAILKAKYDLENAEVSIDEDSLFFPNQEVQPAFVRITDFPPDPSWNAVVHRHPEGIRRFSGYDWTDICVQYPVSLLFLPTENGGGIFDGSIQIEIAPNSIILLNCDTIIVPNKNKKKLSFNYAKETLKAGFGNFRGRLLNEERM